MRFVYFIYIMLLSSFWTHTSYAQKCVSGNCVNGIGVLVYDNGDKYEGEFSDGVINGKGKFVWKDKSVYEGGFLKGKRSGFGVYSVEAFSGQYILQKEISGNPEFVQKNVRLKSYRYEGAWLNDVKEGKGKEIWDDGDSFEGEFRNNKRNGIGIYKWSDGSIYSGQWDDDFRNGEGEIKYSDGGKYLGMWKNDIKFRDEKYQCSDGFKYADLVPNVMKTEIVFKGSSVNEPYRGKWTMIEKDGSEKEFSYVSTAYQYYYEGSLDVAFGQAKWGDGTVHLGTWKNNRPHGCGIRMYKSGAKFVGEFLDGEETENGIRYLPNGTVYPQKWKNGVYKK